MCTPFGRGGCSEVEPALVTRFLVALNFASNCAKKSKAVLGGAPVELSSVSTSEDVAPEMALLPLVFQMGIFRVGKTNIESLA